MSVSEQENTIKKLSQDSRAILQDLFSGKFIPESKLSKLEKELQQAENHPTNTWNAKISRSIQNAIGSRISSSDVLNKLQQDLNASALATVDATYKTDGKGILDLAYANSSIGFAYVADGTSHDNPVMAQALKNVFDPWTANYENAFKEQIFATQEDYSTFLLNQLKNLDEALIASTDPVYPDTDARLEENGDRIPNAFITGAFRPIGCFSQIAKIGDQLQLVHVSKGDSLPVIKKANGEIIIGNIQAGLRSTLGSSIRTRDSSAQPYKAEFLPLEEGDQVIIVTDGIGEYLPPDIFERVIKDNTHPHLLKDELKEAAIKFGLNNNKPEGKFDLPEGPNGSILHYYNPFHPDDYDDIGLAMLMVPKATEEPQAVEV